MAGPTFQAGAIEATARIDKSEFIRDLRQMQSDIVAFQRNSMGINVKINKNEVKSQLLALKKELGDSKDAKINIAANATQARRDVAEFRSYVRSLNPIGLSISGNLAQARRDVASYRSELRASRATNLSVGANVGQARRDVAALKAFIRNGSTNININTSALAASMGMQQVNSQVQNLNGKSATIRIAMGPDASRIIGIIGLLTAGLSSIAYLAPAAAAGVAGLGVAAGVAGQGLTAAALGLRGVKDAYQAISQEAQTSSVREGVSHSGVESSLRSLDNVRRSAVKTAQNSALAVMDAERSAARTAITSTRAIEDAKRSEAQTTLSNNRSIEDAERNLSRAKVAATEAVQQLNEARKQEIIDLDDLQLRLRGTSLSEEEATAALTRAKKHLELVRRDPLASRNALEVNESILAIKRAQLTLDESKKSYKDTQAEAARAGTVGVESSERIAAAQKQVLQANEQVEDSQRNLDRARIDSAYQQEQASRAVTLAVDDARYAQEQASRSVTDAIRSGKEAQQDSAHSIADALAAVEDAQNSAANTGVRAFNRIDDAMSKLTPAGREFVHFLYDEARPAVSSISDEIASRMLPQLTVAGRQLLTLVPELRTGLGETGDVIGRLSIAGANLVTSGLFRRDFADIMHANNIMLEDAGVAGLSLLNTITSLYVVSTPIAERFTNWTATSLALFDSWIQGKRATGELAAFMEEAGEKGEELWDLFVKLITTGYDLASALAPVGSTVLSIVGGVADFVGWLSQLNPELVTFLGYAILAYAAFVNIGKGVLALGSATTLGIRGFEKLLEIMTNVSLGAGTFTEKVTGSATAGQKVADAGGKMTSAIQKMGAAIPIAGAALIGLTIVYDHFVVSADDAATAILRGGAAADQARAKVDAYAVKAPSWAIGYGALRTSMDDVTKAINEQLDAMDPLTRAQTLAKQAQQDYLTELNKAEPDYAKVRDAQERFGIQTKEVTRLQKSLEIGLDDTTTALRKQADQILGVVEADIKYRDTLQRVTESIKDNGRTIDLNTEAGRRNQQILIDLVRAGEDHEDSMKRNGATATQLAIRHNELREQFRLAAIQMGFNAHDAQVLTDKYYGIPRRVDTEFIANVFPAVDAVQRMANDIARITSGIADQEVSIKFNVPVGTFTGPGIGRFVQGGPIIGEGTETSDSNLALLSNNEHVWSAQEVHGAGGHTNVEYLRKLAREGKLISKYVHGGAVEHFNALGTQDVVNANARVIRSNLRNFATPFVSGSRGGGGGVEQWRSVGLQALAITGQSLANIERLLMQMRTESGGRIDALNKVDINWINGTPSVGLMQVIGPTYNRWKHPTYDIGPYLYGTSINPLANILASIRYTLARYGSLTVGWKGHGYANGGLINKPTMAMLGESGPEVVLPLNRSERVKTLLKQSGLADTINSTTTTENTGLTNFSKHFADIQRHVVDSVQDSYLYAPNAIYDNDTTDRTIPSFVSDIPIATKIPQTLTAALKNISSSTTNAVNSNANSTNNNTNNSVDRQPTVGTLVMQVPYGASPQEYVEHLDFELQYRRKKGVYR